MNNKYLITRHLTARISELGSLIPKIMVIKNNVPLFPPQLVHSGNPGKQRKKVGTVLRTLRASRPSLFTSGDLTRFAVCWRNRVRTFHHCHCEHVTDPDLKARLLHVTSAIGLNPYKHAQCGNQLVNASNGSNLSSMGSSCSPWAWANYWQQHRSIVSPPFATAPDGCGECRADDALQPEVLPWRCVSSE